MKRLLAFFAVLALSQGLSAFAQGQERGGWNKTDNGQQSPAVDQGNTQGQKPVLNSHRQAPNAARKVNRVARPSNNRKPVQIQLSNPENNKGGNKGGNNFVERNAGSFQAFHVQPNQNIPNRNFNDQVSKQWNRKYPGNNINNQPRGVVKPGNFSNFQVAQVSGSNVSHHHPFQQGYVRKKLQKLGIRAIPQPIAERRQILFTDRAHSTIRFPDRGWDRQPLRGTLIRPIRFDIPLVRNHMALVANLEFTARIGEFNRAEVRRNFYYWHQDSDFNYCHYVDNWGYHWYGWYVGSDYFWTRYYQSRWWWYDIDHFRWCFWNGGRWWWQDPNHVGDLYVFVNNNYVPCNSANDPVVVNAAQNGNVSVYHSSDGSRMVKVVSGGDAFLFDTAIPPAFNPIYLASNVSGVRFSNTSNGEPLQVLLELNDGTFDLFDNQGNALNYTDTNFNQGDNGNTDNNPPTQQ